MLPPPTQRDTRLDFWRGLCLLDMILVHLVYDGVNFGPVQRIVGEYTRFAAGGFVFVAGLSIGAIFLPKSLKPGGRTKIYPSLLKRSGYILAVHFASALSFVALDLLRGMRADTPALFPLFRNILLFREGGDLLPLYVIIIACSPAVIELLRHRLASVLALISLSLFAIGQFYPWLFSTPLHQNFPVILWQLIFVAGVLFGNILPSYTALAPKKKLLLTAAAAAVSILLWAADFRSDFNWLQPNLPFAFAKTPLSAAEAARYLALVLFMIFTTDLLWSRIAQSSFVGVMRALGRRSLAVYVAHVWVVGLIASLAWSLPGLGAAQMLLAIPAVAACWLIAQGLDWVNRSPSTPTPRHRWAPLPFATALAALAFVAAARFFPAPPATPQPAVEDTHTVDSVPDSDIMFV